MQRPLLSHRVMSMINQCLLFHSIFQLLIHLHNAVREFYVCHSFILIHLVAWIITMCLEHIYHEIFIVT